KLTLQLSDYGNLADDDELFPDNVCIDNEIELVKRISLEDNKSVSSTKHVVINPIVTQGDSGTNTNVNSDVSGPVTNESVLDEVVVKSDSASAVSRENEKLRSVVNENNIVSTRRHRVPVNRYGMVDLRDV